MALLSIVAWLPAMAELHVDQKNEKFGYVDDAGKVVIKHQYSQAFPFVNGKAKVQKSKKWGYIDEKGKAVIKIEFDEIGEFNDYGVARVTKGGKYGYIYRDGKYMIKPDFNFIGTVNEDGYCWVAKGKSLADAMKGLYKGDKVIAKPIYKYIGVFQTTDSADYASGILFDGPNISEIKGNFSKLSTSDVPYVWAKAMNNKHYILNPEGKYVLKDMSGAIGAPVNDIALTRIYNKKKNTYTYNYVVTDGKFSKLFKKDVTVSCDGKDICMPFYRGTALNVINGNGYLIDKTGQRVSSQYEEVVPIENSLFIVMKRNRYGLMDHSGNEVVDCQYGKINAPIHGSEYLGVKDMKSGLFGLIDLRGNEVLPFVYDEVHGEKLGHVGVKKDSGWGLVDLSGNEIVPFEWNSVFYPKVETNTHYWVQSSDDKKWRCYNVSTKRFDFGYVYDGVYSSFDNDGMSVVVSGDKYGAVTNNGVVAIPTRFFSADVVGEALSYVRGQGKSVMGETEAYRFSLYHNPARNSYRLHQTIEETMWDY